MSDPSSPARGRKAGQAIAAAATSSPEYVVAFAMLALLGASAAAALKPPPFRAAPPIAAAFDAPAPASVAMAAKSDRPQSLERAPAFVAPGAAEIDPARFGAPIPRRAVATGNPPDDGMREETAIAGERTASVASDAATVEVAETEAEAVRIEAALAGQEEAEFALPAAKAARAARTASRAPLPAAALGKGWTVKFVNMRAAPDNGAAVVAVVPANAEIRAESGCQHWCSAAYRGKRGFIYKDLLRYPQKKANVGHVDRRPAAPDAAPGTPAAKSSFHLARDRL